jgi:hypothetical protein
MIVVGECRIPSLEAGSGLVVRDGGPRLQKLIRAGRMPGHLVRFTKACPQGFSVYSRGY